MILGRYESAEHVYNHGFVAPSKPPAVEERKRTKQMPADYNPRRSDPLSRELNEEVEEERIEMERRNQSQLRKARQNNIPQLDLVDSEDEERARGRGFTDLEIDDGRRFDSAETVAEQLWAAKQRNVLVAKGARMGSTEGKTEARQKVLQQSNFTGVKPAPISSQHQTLPPIVPQQYYNPDNQVQQQIFFQPVGIPSDEQTAPRGFLPFQPYTIDGAGEDPGQNVTRPLRQTESGRPANQNRVVSYQRRAGSESNVMRMMPQSADQTNSAKDYIRANRREVIRKEKPKKSYGEMFSDRRKKENVDASPMQRWRSEEARVRQPMSENHGFRNPPGDFIGQPPAAMGNHPVAMTQQAPVGMAQHSTLAVAYPSYISPAQPMPINVDPVSLPYAAQPVNLTYHQPPVALTQQPSHQFHGGGYPFQQMPLAAAVPVEHQQRISIPLQFQGNSTTDQQKVSVDINLRLLNAESEIQPPFSPSKIDHQQLQTNGNPLPSYAGQSQAVVGNFFVCCVFQV